MLITTNLVTCDFMIMISLQVSFKVNHCRKRIWTVYVACVYLFISYIILPTSFVVINLILICLIHFFRETIQGREDFLSFVVSMRGQALQPYWISVFLSNIHDKWTVKFLNVTFSYSKTTQSGSFLLTKKICPLSFFSDNKIVCAQWRDGIDLLRCLDNAR